MKHFPDHDLRLAGAGPFERELRKLAGNLPNVHFVGLLDFPRLATLFHQAQALLVPSLFYETFGLVVAQAFTVRTPAIVHHRGALPELVLASNGGITYRNPGELLEAMRQMASNEPLRQRLGEQGCQAVKAKWSEDAHIERYLRLIEKVRDRRSVARGGSRDPGQIWGDTLGFG
jgi:glycosyltransferase involved in cell wall biosynthesis